MALTTLNDIVAGLTAGDRQRFQINKATVTSVATGRYASLWRATGTPAQANIPSTVEVCNKSTLGAWAFNSADSGKYLYWVGGFITNAIGGNGFEFHDRLVQMGGLSANITTSQTVGLDLTSTSSNLQQRIGASSLSEIQWWFEVHTAVGSTAFTLTVNVTYTDSTTGSTVAVSVPASTAANNSFILSPGTAGKVIKSIDSCSLSIASGSVGSIGFAATRRLWSTDIATAYATKKLTWMDTDATVMYENTCVSILCMPSNSTTGALVGGLNVINK